MSALKPLPYRPLSLRLGLQMFVEGAQCPVCHTVADPYGDHHIGCGGNGDTHRILRHNAFRDAIFSAAQSAALAPRREVPSLIPNSLSRPADIYLPSLKRGHPAALDVTVISTMQQATIQSAATTRGHALLVGESRKLGAHADACQVSFIPVVVGVLEGCVLQLLVLWPVSVVFWVNVWESPRRLHPPPLR